MKFRLGNGQYLIAKTGIKFDLLIQGNKFSIFALVADQLTGIDLILGTETLSQLDGSLDFRSNRFRIAAKKIYFKPTAKVVIRPGETKYVVLKGNVPSIVKNAEVVIHANSHLSKLCPTDMLIRLRKGRTSVPVTNTTDRNISLDKDRNIASFSLNSFVSVVDPLSSDDIANLCKDLGANHLYSSNAETRSDIERDNLKKYPHLSPDDPLVSMTESEVFRKQVSFEDSILDKHETETMYKFLEKHRDAFSLYGELSSCPNFEVDIHLTNEEPFFIRPYFTTEADKVVIERELDKLVKLGIMGVGHQAYTSPVLLLPKKGSNEKRVVTDFRFLNSRISRKNCCFNLLSHTLKRIGNSEAKVISVMDLKSAFFSIPLSPRSFKYVGVAGFHGGKHYFYKRLAQGLNVSPAIFQAKIDEILSEIPNSREFCIAHHDDLIIFSPDRDKHRQHLGSILQALIKHGLRVSPGKAKLFRRSVIYMGHKISINAEGHACIEPLGDRCAAIQKMPRPKNPREVKRLIGAVNFISNFFPHVQKVLRPLHKLTRKNKPFIWEQEHEESFCKIQELMSSPSVLHMPRKHGRFKLYSDTSRYATGSYLTQTDEKGTEHLLGYYSKVLPASCQRYSVTELELTGLWINVNAFKHILKGVEFDAYVDHSAIVQIMKSKQEPCTLRLQKLLLKLSEFSFLTYYKRGSDLCLADFFSRAPRDDDSDIDRIEPIAFPLLHDEILKGTHEIANPMTRSYAKAHGISVPDVWENPGKSASKKRKGNGTQQRSAPSNHPVSNTQPVQNPIPRINTDNALSDYDLPYGQADIRQPAPVQPLTRPHSNKPSPVEPRLIDLNKETLEEDHRGVPPELTTPPKPLIPRIDKVEYSHIPRQAEVDRIMRIIKRKIIRDYNLPVDLNAVKTGQESSPFFKPVYDYLAYGILPHDKKAAKGVQIRSDQFILVNGLLFRLFLHDNDDNFTFQLAVPENMAEMIISRYHDNLLSNHQGVVRTYLTIRRNYYIKDCFQKISCYIRACHRCSQFKGKVDKLRPYHERIPESYKPFDTISLDFKTMPPSHTKCNTLMVVVDQMTRYLIAVPLPNLHSSTIADALIAKVIAVFGPPSRLITDAATSLIGKVLTAVCETLKIDHKTISVENHGSLHVERHIGTLSNFLKVNLNQFGTDWIRYVPTACYAYNSFSSVQLAGMSPFELVYGRPPKDLTNLSFNPMDNLSESYEEYAANLKRRFKHISQTMIQLQRVQQEKQNVAISQKLRRSPIYSVGQLVYLFKPTSSALTANSRKIRAEWVGPLVIHSVLDRTHYTLATLEGKLLADVFNYNRLKACFIKPSGQTKHITYINQLREALNNPVALKDQAKAQPEQTVHFMDENGETLPNITSDQFVFVGITDPVDLTLHVECSSQNRGLAVPSVLSEDKLRQQMMLILEAPSERNHMVIQRARFKGGNLQVLISVERSETSQVENLQKNGSDFRFWLDVENCPEAVGLADFVLLQHKVPCAGSPKNFLMQMYAL